MNTEVYKPQDLLSYLHLPRWVDTIPPEYKRLRLFVGEKYGNITLIGSFIIIFLIPAWNAIKEKRIIHKYHHPHQASNRSLSFFHRFYQHSVTAKIIIFWSLLSFIVNYADTYNDLLFITKRLGRISAACMPAILFITLRPSPLPRTLYLSLLPIHKWLSRIIVLEAIGHTILYLIYYQRINALGKLYKMVNIDGFIALFAFILIGITSLPKVRRSFFKLFYIMHYVMTWISVITLHYHARPGIGLYTFMNSAILLFQIVYRVSHTLKTKISVVPISPSLALVEFPSTALMKKSNLPGSHVRINNKNGLLKDIFYQIIPLAHPFTVASLPNDPTVKLIIRRGAFPLLTNKDYYVTGLFEPELTFIKEPSIFERLFSSSISPAARLLNSSASPLKYTIDAKRVLIVVGGSGVSFGIPLLRILNYNGISARLIWVCKDIKDLNLLNNFRGLQGIECYITGDLTEDDIFIDYFEDDAQAQNNSIQKISDYGSTENTDEIDFTTVGRSYKEAHKKPSLPSLTDGSITESFQGHENVNIDISGTCEYRDIDPTTGSSNVISTPPEEIDAEAFKSIKIPKSVHIYYGRPNLNAEHYEWCLQSDCVGPTFTQNGCVCCRDLDNRHQDVEKSKIWVVAAGPAGLVDHAKQWAVDGGLQCHIESFAV